MQGRIFEYIATNPQVLGGKPIIKGARIRVECILELVASGASVQDIVAGYPDLPGEAVKAAITKTMSFSSPSPQTHTPPAWRMPATGGTPMP